MGRWGGSARTFSRLALLVGLAAVAASAQEKPALRIGVVLDGPSERSREIRTTFERQIGALLGEQFNVQFPAAKQREADWTAKGVKTAVDQLLADSEVDHVLALGILSSTDVALRGPLPRPCFAAFVLEPFIHGIPIETREHKVGQGQEVWPVFDGEKVTTRRFTREQPIQVSGVTNLNYLTLGNNLHEDVAAFSEVARFTRLTILYPQQLEASIPDFEGRAQSMLWNHYVRVVPVGPSLDEALANIPDDTEAVYVGPLWRLSSGELDRLVKTLIQRRLPSFSASGRDQVAQGLLAGLGQEELSRRAERLASNLKQVLEGLPAAEVPVNYQRPERLTLNLATARALGLSLDPKITADAELLHQ